MKLILAVINRDDSNSVTQSLSKKGFSSTRLSTTGGFLRAGNVTLLVGVEEEKVPAVIEIIREHCHSRKQLVPSTADLNYGYAPASSVEITVGGATIFVLDVDHFEQL